jgi:hypothetical protein
MRGRLGCPGRAVAGGCFLKIIQTTKLILFREKTGFSISTIFSFMIYFFSIKLFKKAAPTKKYIATENMK